MEVDVLSDNPLAPVLPEVEPIAIPNALPVIEPQPNWKDVEGLPAPVISEQDLVSLEAMRDVGNESPWSIKSGVSEQDAVSLEAMRGLRQSPWDTIPLPDDWRETQAAKQAAGERDATVAEIREANKLKDEIDPIFDLPAGDLADMAEVKDNQFDLVSEMLERRAQWTPELQAKVSEAHRILNERRRIIPTGKDIVESGVELPTMFADWAAATFLWAKKFKTGVIGESAPSPLSSILSGRGPVQTTPEEKEAIRLREQKAAGEAMAASAASIKHFGTDLPISMIDKILGEAPTKWTPEKSAKELAAKISTNIERKNILAGGGTGVPQFIPEVRAEMKAADSDIDPAVSEEIEAGDPFSLMAVGPAFKGIGAVLKIPGIAFGAAKRAGLGAATDAAFIASAPAELQGALLGAFEREAAKRGVIGEVSKAAGEIIGPAARAVDKRLAAVGKFIPTAQTVVGKSIQSVGVVADTFAKWAEKITPIAVPLAAAASAASAGAALPGLGQVVAALSAAGGTRVLGAARPVMATLGAIRKQAQNLGYTGKSVAAKTAAEIAETPIRGNAAAAIKGAAQSVPGVVEGAVHGAALDLSLAALTTLTSDNHSALQLGAALGIAGGLRSGLIRTAGEVRMGARDWGSDTPVPTSGAIQPLESMSAAAYAAAPRGIQRRVNAIRQILKGVDANADLFMSDPTKIEQRQGREIHTDTEQALLALGFSKAQAEFYAGQNGWFDANVKIPGQPEKTKRVIVVNNVDSAPHEAKHAFQNVNGELANQVLDRVVRDSFSNEMWDFLGRDYTQKLLQRGLRPNESWVDLVLDASGDGAAAADLKLKLHAVEELQRTLGREATNEEIRGLQPVTLTGGELTPAVTAQGGWREVLTPAEKKAAADKYIAREISAETFDAVFKHFGPAMAEKGGLISFFAKLVAATTDLLGGDSLRGRTSEVLDVPLKAPIIEAVTAQVRGRLAEVAGRPKPVVTPATAAARPGAPAGTPEQEAVNTADVAANAPEQPTGPEIDAQSPREILGTFAESKATGQGVKITRRSAPGTPAGAIEVSRGRRREQIETARGIPDDQKPLWEKNFTPVKTVVLNDGSIQEQGWSPEVLAANAEKTAKFLSDTNPSLSPFEIDTARKTFTASGWKNLFDKVNIFAANQAAGLTGKGTPLVIGRAREFGFFEPTGTREAVGTLTDAEANFINYLFGFPLPGKGPVLKRGGKAQFGEQLITEATEPGRAQPLVEPRTFGSKQAEQLGFAGEQLLEVNPLRTQIEQAGENPPSLIEAWQNLNLKDIVRADIAPELPAVRPVGVTLRAGFSPKMEGTGYESHRDLIDDVNSGKFGEIFGFGYRSDARKNWLKTVADIADSADPFVALQLVAEEKGSVKGNLPAKEIREMLFDDIEKLGRVKDQIREARGYTKEDLDFARAKQTGNESQALVKFSPKPTKEITERFKSSAPEVKDESGAPKIFYHGSFKMADMIESLKESGFDISKTSNVSLFGPGFYFTSDPNVAGGPYWRNKIRSWFGKEPLGYAFKSTSANDFFPEPFPKFNADAISEMGGTPGIYPAFLDLKNPLNMEKHYPNAELRPILDNILSKSGAGKGYYETVFQGYERDGWGITGQGFYRHLEDLSGAIKKGRSSSSDSGLVNKWLQEAGFDGVAYVGGVRRKGTSLGKHSVMVAFKNEQIVSPYETEAKGPIKFAPMPANEMAIRSAAIKDETTGRIYESGIHAIAREDAESRGAKGPFTDGFVTNRKLPNNEIEFLSRDESFARAEEINQLPAGQLEMPGGGLESTRFEEVRRFSPSKDRKEIELIGPDGKKYRAMFDGYMDMSLIGLGQVPQITPLQDLPGSKVKGSTTYGPSLEKAGYKLPADLPAPEITETGEAQFSPRKRKEADPLKFLGTQHGNASKAWILPSGKVEQLGAQWHHDWLSENTEVAAKYKIDVPAFEGTDTEGVREGALNKGFARVNLDNGVLVVEVREKNWRNVRPIIEDLIEKNLDDIDRFRVGLLNDTATDLRKTFTAKLFDADNDQAKMERVYEAFSEEAQREIGRETRFSPKRGQFEDPETIREALSSPGWAIITGTQEAQGKWNAPANVEANKALEADLQEKGYEYIPVKGTYKGVPQGADFLVLDISTYDAQALGKKYKQESVLTPKGLLYGDGTITEGDTANALLGAEARKQDFFSTLPNGLSFSVPLDFSKAPYQPVGEQSTLFGGREYESPANFTQAELRQRHPEAIVPSNSKEKIGSDIVNSPLYKQSDNPVNAFADKLVEFTRQYEDNPVYQLGLKWYSDIVPMLKKEFGKDAPMMTELLAASSPNEKPDMNFFYAVDALEGFKSGRFDKIVSKFNEGFDLYKSDKWLSWYNRELKAGNIVNPPKEPTPEAFLASWIYKHDLKPKQSNGQLYGFHGKAILEVLAGKWLQQNKGPKVANFVQNLQGTGHEATIDVWADRTMRRIGYADSKNRWRIMPANGEGVSDADFAFSQKAFRAAADKLGIEADALQGGLWFAEKSLWSDNGWGRLDLGSYAVEMGKLSLIRQAIKQRLTKTARRAKITPMKTGELKFSPKGEWTEGRDAREGDDGIFYEFFTHGDQLPVGSVQEDVSGTWTALFKAGREPKVRTFDDEQVARDWIESQTETGELKFSPAKKQTLAFPIRDGEVIFKLGPYSSKRYGKDVLEGKVSFEQAGESVYGGENFYAYADEAGSIIEKLRNLGTRASAISEVGSETNFDSLSSIVINGLPGVRFVKDLTKQTAQRAKVTPMKTGELQFSPKSDKQTFKVGPLGRTDESILASSPEEAFRSYEKSHKIRRGSIASKNLTYRGPYSEDEIDVQPRPTNEK